MPDTVLLEGNTAVLIAGVVEPVVHVVLSATGVDGPLLQTTSDFNSSFVGTRHVVLPPKLPPFRPLQLVYAVLVPVPFRRYVEELLHDWSLALQYSKFVVGPPVQVLGPILYVCPCEHFIQVSAPVVAVAEALIVPLRLSVNVGAAGGRCTA